MTALPRRWRSPRSCSPEGGSSVLHIMLRVVAVYVFFLVVFRLLGKRELSQLSPFELVTLMLIPETVSNGLSGQASLVNALVGASTVFLLVILSSVIAHRYRKVEGLFESEPTVLVRAGKLCQRAMN